MREIKFRAWDENLKLMINPYCELKDGRFWGEDCTNNPYSVKHEHVMQFTGLKDKYGKEIYNSDFVKDNSGNIMEVIWREDLASFALRKDGWAYDHYFGEAVDAGHTEIIGNVYANSELLK